MGFSLYIRGYVGVARRGKEKKECFVKIEIILILRSL
jgi:hypothetical protein